MPYADPEREVEYQAKWRAEHTEYHREWNRRHPRAGRNLTTDRTKMLRDEDMPQQAALARLSRRASDTVAAYGKRERQWIAITGSLAESFEDGRANYGGHAKVDDGIR